MRLVVYLDLVDMPEVVDSILLDLVLVVLLVEPMDLEEADKLQVVLMDLVLLEQLEVDSQDIRRVEVHLAEDSCHKDLF